MSKTGLIIGKFYPPHVGHHFLIDTALAECPGGVVVLVLWNRQEKLNPETRSAILRKMHPKAMVHTLQDEIPTDYTSATTERQHAALVADYVSPGYKITHLYTSEEYGESFATALSGMFASPVEHRMVDLNRIAHPVSATKIREDIRGHWNYLSPPAKVRLTKQVVVCGAESSGTTTLAKALAERYQTVWVPEYGRTFSEAVGLHHIWTTDDFLHIMREQNRMGEDLAHFAGPVMFHDTDNIATLMFHELYMGKRAPEAHWKMAKDWAEEKILYIVTSDNGVKFDDDGYRLFPSQRHWATSWFTSRLESLRLDYMVVSGDHAERMDQATNAIEPMLEWNFPSVPEHGKVEHLA